MIAAYSPEARERSERFLRTLQELALVNITTMEAANRFLSHSTIKRFNGQFMVQPTEPDSAFVPLMGVDIDNILCRQVERQPGSVALFAQFIKSHKTTDTYI